MPLPAKRGEIEDPIITKVDPINGTVIIEHARFKQAVLLAPDGTFAVRDANGVMIKTTVIDGVPTLQINAARLQFYSAYKPEFIANVAPAEPEGKDEPPKTT